MNTSLLILDIDGTMLDSYDIDSFCYKTAAESILNSSMEHNSWDTFENVTDEGILNELFLKHLNRVPFSYEVNNFKATFLNLLKASGTIIEINGLSDFLKSIKNRKDWCLAIATGGWLESAMLKIDLANVKLDNTPICTSNDSQVRIKIIEKVIELSKSFYGIKAFDKIVYIGDGIWDLNAAKELRIDFIGMNSRKETIFTGSNTPIVKNFDELTSLLFPDHYQ